MPCVAALYRYPIKGLSPEPADSLRVGPDGRIEGDRVLAFRHADATEPEEYDGLPHWPKGGGLCVRDYPALTRISLDYTADEVLLRTGGEVIARAGLDDSGRAALVAALTDYLLDTPDGARLARDGHMPLSLIGDGHTATFQDRSRGYVTVHSRASLGELERAVGADLDERRFRSNIALAGMEAWAEDELIGHQVRIGTITFDVTAPIVRCLAIHANPDTGLRDARVMTALTRTLGRPEPSFGVLLLPAAGPGDAEPGEGREIAVGDPVELLG